MSQPSCDACANLREDNASFVMNGVTDTVANSLKNNTGFNPTLTSLHTDCEDLNDANDCLIGHMDDDLDNFEICDLKDFLHNLLPNLYEVLKAMIAAICGLWTKTEKHDDDIANLTKLICGSIAPPYVTVPASVGTHYYNTKEYWLENDTNRWSLTFSLQTAKLGTCSGSTVNYFRVCTIMNDGAPATATGAQIIKEIPVGATLSAFTKADLVPTYMSEALWNKITSRAKQYGITTSFANNTIAGIGARGTFDAICETDGDTIAIKLYGLIGTDSSIGGFSTKYPEPTVFTT